MLVPFCHSIIDKAETCGGMHDIQGHGPRSTIEARKMRASLAVAGIQLLPQGSSQPTREIRFLGR